MNLKEEEFADKFCADLGALLKEINNNSTSQRALASLAKIDKDMVTRIFNGRIRDFRVLVALMAVIFESRGARLDDMKGQEKDDIRRFFIGLERSFRECLEAYEMAPDFAPRPCCSEVKFCMCYPEPRSPINSIMPKLSRLITRLKNGIKKLYERMF